MSSELASLIVSSAFSREFKTCVLNFLKRVIETKENHILVLKGPWAVGKTLLLNQIVEELKKKFGEDVAIVYVDVRRNPMSSIFRKILRELDDFGIDVTLSLFMYILYKKFVERMHKDPACEMMPSVDAFLEGLKYVLSLSSIGAEIFFAEKLKEHISEKFYDEIPFLKKLFGEEYHKKISEMLFNEPLEFLLYLGRILAHDIEDAIKDEDADAIVIVVDSVEEIDKFTLLALVELIRRSIGVLCIFSGRMSPREIMKQRLSFIESAIFMEALNILEKEGRLKVLEFQPPKEETLRDYLRRHGITDEELQTCIITVTREHPLILELATLATKYLSIEEFKISLKKGYQELIVKLFDKIISTMDDDLKRAFYTSLLFSSFNERLLRLVSRAKVTINDLIKLRIYRKLKENKYIVYDKIQEILCEYLKNDKIFNEIKERIFTYYRIMYRKTRNIDFLMGILSLTRLNSETEFSKMLIKVFEDNFRNANFETCLRILDLFNVKTKHDECLKMLMYYRILSHIYKVSTDELRRLIESCEKIENTSNMLRQYLGIDYAILGEKLLENNKVSAAISALEKARKYLEESRTLAEYDVIVKYFAKVLFLIGCAYLRDGNMDRAEIFLKEAKTVTEEIMRKKKMYEDVGVLYGNIIQSLVKILIALGDYTDAMYYLKKALKIIKSLQSKIRTFDVINLYGILLESLSILMMRLGNINEAKVYVKEAMKLYRRLSYRTEFRFPEILNNYGLALALNGEILLRANKIDEALSYLREAASMFLLSIVSSDYRLGEAISNYTRILQLIAILLITAKRENEAIDILEDAIEQADTALEITHYEIPELWILRGDLYRSLAKASMMIGDFEEAIDSIQASINSYETALELTIPGDLRAKLGYALAHATYGDILVEMSNINDALENYQEAMKILKEIYENAEGTIKEIIDHTYEDLQSKIEKLVQAIKS